MANFIQYGDKKLPMGDMKLEEAKEVMKRHFPELANMKVDEKKEGEDTIYVLSKQAGTKGNDLGAVATSLQAIKPAPFFNARVQKKAWRLINGNETSMSDDDVEAIVKDMHEEANRVQMITTRTGRIPSAYPASEVVLL